MTIELSFRGAFGASRKVLRQNYGMLLLLLALPALLMALTEALGKAVPAMSFLDLPIALFLTTLFWMWTSAATLQTLKSEKVSFQALLSTFDWSQFGQGLLGTLLIMGGCFLGTLLFIIPGIIFSTSTLFFMFIMVNERLGAVDAIKRSFQLMKGHRIKFFFGLLLPPLLIFSVGMAYYTHFADSFSTSAMLLPLILVQVLFLLMAPLGLLMLGHSYLQLHRAAGRKRRS